MGDTDRLVESALDLCVCNGAIYEETVAPFLEGELLFATEAAVQILAVPVHLLPLWDSPPPFQFPTLHRHTLHLSNTQRKTDSQ